MTTTTIPFVGQHCETTATGTLLNQIGIELSEPMLFGLGEGLSFLFWKMKAFEFPFLGGRIKTDLVTQNIVRNLGLKMEVRETSSQKKAWKNVADKLDAGIPVGLKLDCFHLEYFTVPFHFAGHYVAMLGYDQLDAWLVDTDQQGGKVKTSLDSLAAARSERGPMSSRNLSYTIEAGDQDFDLSTAVVAATKANANAYLNPPIKNVSFRGLAKTAKEIPKWFDQSDNIEEEFSTSAMLMDRAGTGGALFRKLYRDFLKESFALTGNDVFCRGYEDFREIADDWNKVIRMFEAIATASDKAIVDEVCEMFEKLSVTEREAMERLANGLLLRENV